MTAVDRITAIVAEHEAKGFGCRGCDWLSVFEGAPYMEQFSRHVAERIAAVEDLAVVEVPVVAHKAVGVIDAEVYMGAAWRIEGGYAPGGSNTTAAVVELLRRVAKAAEGVSDRGDN